MSVGRAGGEHERARLRDCERAAGERGAQGVELGRREPWSSTTSTPAGRHSGGSAGGTPSRRTPRSAQTSAFPLGGKEMIFVLAPKGHVPDLEKTRAS